MALTTTIEHLDITCVRNKPAGKRYDLVSGRTTGERTTGDRAERYVSKVGSTTVHQWISAQRDSGCRLGIAQRRM
jgi:hypothetical protein